MVEITGEQRTDFTDKVVLIAGASQGIGAGTAQAFAAAGARVVLGARNQERVEGVAAAIRDRGGQAVAVRADVADEELSRRLVDTALETYGRLYAAFNNATDGPMPAPLAEIATDEFDLGISVNIRGTYLGMKYQVPAMLQNDGGAIVNMASGAGFTGHNGLAAYVAGKAGIIGLTKAAALDYADQGIRINVLAPGTILTEHLAAAGDRAQELAAQATPMRRIGRVEEVADAVMWLCSDRSSFITGVTLPIDGGQSAGSKNDKMYRPGQPME